MKRVVVRSTGSDEDKFAIAEVLCYDNGELVFSHTLSLRGLLLLMKQVNSVFFEKIGRFI